MDEDKIDLLCEITWKLGSLTAVLVGYCKNCAEESKEIGSLVEFSEILHKTASQLYELF